MLSLYLRMALAVAALLLFHAVWNMPNTETVEAHHNIALPGIPNTPAIQQSIKPYGSIAYCLNDRASNYPNFRAQLREVMDSYEAETGVKAYEVAYGTPWGFGPASGQTGCAVQHNMTSGFCNGCAANVTYANWPVVVQYDWTLGFARWLGTQAHEFGHILGLHEMYTDLGSIQCRDRPALGEPLSVMSCGWQTGHGYVERIQPFDIGNLKGWLFPRPTTEGSLATYLGDRIVWFKVDQFRSDHAAIMYYDALSDQYYWSGVVAYPSGDGYSRAVIYCHPGRQIWVNQQSSTYPVHHIWGLRNDTLVGYC